MPIISPAPAVVTEPEGGTQQAAERIPTYAETLYDPGGGVLVSGSGRLLSAGTHIGGGGGAVAVTAIDGSPVSIGNQLPAGVMVPLGIRFTESIRVSCSDTNGGYFNVEYY
ncbi:hypothetical protein [Ferrimonas balearica]|uniref:hypothetical protein n=1 Tax=Ferrimonas balearica TaxID=44012 RepID=UPI001F336171|nr:hypothetical protein [Ferrimonas balearica]MBY6095123.1 hypothetical protein [Ferrimonas balearica]